MGVLQLSVGSVFPMSESHLGEAIVRCEYEAPCWMLIVGYPDLTKSELHHFLNEKLSLTFVDIDDALFVVMKAGEISWCDAPFEPRLYKQQTQFPIDFAPQEGAPLLLVVLDTNTNIIHGIRSLGMGHDQTVALHTICNEKIANIDGFDKDAYHQKIETIYQEFPLPENMVAASDPSCLFEFT